MKTYKNKTEREFDSLVKTRFSFSIPLRKPIEYIKNKLKKIFNGM